VLPGIAEEIVKHDLKQPFIPVGFQALLDLEPDFAFRLSFDQRCGDTVRYPAQVDRPELQLAHRKLRKLEKVVNQKPHLVASCDNPRKVVFDLFIKPVGILTLHNAAVTADMAKWCPKVV